MAEIPGNGILEVRSECVVVANETSVRVTVRGGDGHPGLVHQVDHGHIEGGLVAVEDGIRSIDLGGGSSGEGRGDVRGGRKGLYDLLVLYELIRDMDGQKVHIGLVCHHFFLIVVVIIIVVIAHDRQGSEDDDEHDEQPGETDDDIIVLVLPGWMFHRCFLGRLFLFHGKLSFEYISCRVFVRVVE